MDEYLNTLEMEYGKKYNSIELKKQYHKLAKKYHPDRGGDDEHFKKITHAYNMLTNPEYQLEHERKKAPINLNMLLNFTITFEQAFFGDILTFTTNPIFVNESREPVTVDKGTDIFLDVEVITLEIPAGLSHGEQIVIRGRGLCFKERRGDLTVNVNVVSHPKFRLNLPDVVSVEQIPLDIMLRGGSYDVQTMYGLKELIIPQGTMPNTELTIKGCGLQKIGNHVVIVHPIYPTKEELEANVVWKTFLYGSKTPQQQYLESLEPQALGYETEEKEETPF